MDIADNPDGKPRNEALHILARILAKRFMREMRPEGSVADATGEMVSGPCKTKRKQATPGYTNGSSQNGPPRVGIGDVRDAARSPLDGETQRNGDAVAFRWADRLVYPFKEPIAGGAIHIWQTSGQTTWQSTG